MHAPSDRRLAGRSSLAPGLVGRALLLAAGAWLLSYCWSPHPTAPGGPFLFPDTGRPVPVGGAPTDTSPATVLTPYRSLPAPVAGPPPAPTPRLQATPSTFPRPNPEARVPSPEQNADMPAFTIPVHRERPTPAWHPPATFAPPPEQQSLRAVELQPPGPQRLFRLESEAALQERIRQESAGGPTDSSTFPEEPVLSSANRPPVRRWRPAKEVAEPNYVCYDPLLFEQRASERYGWDLGAVQPLLSGGTFYYHLLTLPFKVSQASSCDCECSAGYCLPGDPVPLLLEPPELPPLLTVGLNPPAPGKAPSPCRPVP